MERKIERAKNGIAEVINYLILSAVGVIIQADFTKAGPDFAGIITAGLIPLLFWQVRERCGKFWVFMLLHMLPWGIFLLLYRENTAQKVWLFLVLLLLTGISFRKKLRDSDMGTDAVHPVFAACVLWVLYITDGRMSGGKWGAFLLYIGTGFAAGYFLRYFLHRFLRYMDVNSRTTENIPAGHVFGSAIMLAGGFTAGAAGIMILGSSRALTDRIGEAIWRLITCFLTFLVSLLLKETPNEEDSVLGETGDPNAGMGFFSEPGEPSLLAQVLEAIVEFIVILGLLALAALAIIALIRLIREVFGRRNKYREKEEGFSRDLVEKLEKRKKRQKSEGETFFSRVGKAMSPEERIRRIYRKTLEREFAFRKHEKKGDIPEGATPRECCQELFSEHGQSAFTFACLYEKARYGNGLCSGEDVKRARKLSEEFHR